MKISLKILKILVVLLIAAVAIPATANFFETGSFEQIFAGAAVALAVAPIVGKIETSLQIKEKRGDIHTQLTAMNDLCTREKREFTPSELNTYNSLMQEFDRLKNRLTIVEAEERRAAEMAGNFNNTLNDNPVKPGREQWIDKRSGKVIPVFGKDEKFADSLAPEERGLSIGKLIAGMITGDFSQAEKEQRALGTGIGSGSVLVPSSFYAEVIDKARAKTCCGAAGAKLVDMPGKSMTIARITGDPTFQVKLENQDFNEGVLTLDGVELEAHTIGTIIYMSRELAADSPNAATAIENALINALSVKLDQLALSGAGTVEPLGLLNLTGVQDIDKDGQKLLYGDLVDGWSKIITANGEPTAFIMSPRDAGELSQQILGTGGQYLVAPKLIENIKNLYTSSIPTNLGTESNESYAFAGDFSKMLFAIRQGMQLEVTTTGGDAFKKHQVAVKITWRGDIGIEQPSHFVRMVGIIPADPNA